mgnify:CR=1 FL=1
MNIHDPSRALRIWISRFQEGQDDEQLVAHNIILLFSKGPRYVHRPSRDLESTSISFLFSCLSETIGHRLLCGEKMKGNWNIFSHSNITAYLCPMKRKEKGNGCIED